MNIFALLTLLPITILIILFIFIASRQFRLIADQSGQQTPVAQDEKHIRKTYPLHTVPLANLSPITPIESIVQIQIEPDDP